MIGATGFQALAQSAQTKVHNTLSLVAMAQSGDWVTVLPSSVTRLSPDRLAFRQIKGLDDRRQVSLFLREDSRHLSLAEELCDLICHAVA